MGRGKLSMKLIPDEKSRKTSFHKRKNSILRKSKELSILCDVPTVAFVYGPSQDDQSKDEVYTWPSNRDKIHDVIKAYETNRLNKRTTKCSDLNDFFSNRKKRIDVEISKVRKDVAESKYPKWDERIENFTEEELRSLIDNLDSKIDVSKRMIDLMEGRNHDHDIQFMMGEANHQMMSLNNTNNFNEEFLNEEQNLIFGSSSTVQNNWPLFQEASPPFFGMNHNHFMAGNSDISSMMMPTTLDHQGCSSGGGVDLSNFLFGDSNGADQIQYNYENNNPQPLFFNDQKNNMGLNNIPNYSICHDAMPTQSVLPLAYDLQYKEEKPSTSNLNNASSNLEIIPEYNPYDYIDYEYLMKTNNY